MPKKVLKGIGAILAAIVLISVVNSIFAYHVSRYEGVQFGKYYEYSGVIGVHTTYSDGSGSYATIGRTCDSLGLHFAIIADKNTVQPLRDSLDRRSGMTLIIPAVQMTVDNGSGSFLVVGDSIPLLPGNGISADSVFRYASRKGSLVILCRESESGLHLSAGKPNEADYGGMELYNFHRSWKSMLSVFGVNKLFGTWLAGALDSRSFNYVIRYPEKEMKDFDRINRSRKVIGIGALGARSNIRIWNGTYWHYPSYETMFKLAHTVIVTTTPYNALYRHDRELTLDAIKRGNSYVAFPGLEPARGFLFTATSGNAEATMGDSLRLEGSATIRVSLPDSDYVETQIVRNGETIGTYENKGSTTLTVNTAGIYRVQVFQERIMLPFFIKRSYPWILSNPIYVYKD